MRYEVRPGPDHVLPPAAASMGVRLPNPGEAIVHGYIVPEEQAMEEAARRFLSAKVPTIFPGPLVLWAWTPTAEKKAKAIRHLFEDRAWRDELLHHGDVRASRARGCHGIVSRHYAGSHHPSGGQGA